MRPGREAAFLAPLAIRLLPGIGPRAEAKLLASGIETIGELAALGDGEVRALMPGKVGLMVRDRARGIDPRPLEVSVERISVSVEETFPQDVGDPERLHGELIRMAERLAGYLRDRGQTGRTVTTKLRYPDFAIRTRSTSLPAGTDDAGRIGELACALLDRALGDRPGPLRLVGVGVSGLAEHAQLELRWRGRLMNRDDWTEVAHAGIDLMNPIPPAKLDEVLDLLGLAPGARVIDLGCGKGELLRRLAARYEIRAVGVDRSPSLLEEARRRAPAGVTYIVADLTAFSSGAPFDLAASLGASIDGFRATLGRLAGHLRPGGFALLGEATGAVTPTRPTSMRSARHATRWPTTRACSRRRRRSGSSRATPSPRAPTTSTATSGAGA